MEHSEMMSPDTVSSLFPDRPIRPLPKRRLRERLSPEAADSIKYPPSNIESLPLFYYPTYTLKEEGAHPNAELANPSNQGSLADIERNILTRRNAPRSIRADDTDEASLRSTLVTRPPPNILNRAALHPLRLDQPRNTDSQPPPSTTSSVDGYDSFENANNKKKRKIPSAGDPTINGAHTLNNDISSLSISTGSHAPAGDMGSDRAYHNSNSYPTPSSYVIGSQGVSGSGRGRLGRSRNGRSPLRALSDGNNTWAGRASKMVSQPWLPAPPNTGIISNAIANAGKLPSQGQENVSLLQQSSISKATPASTQFTFTCDSPVPGSVQWPGNTNRQSMGTQTASGIPSSANQGTGMNNDVGSKTTSGGSANSRRKSRRRLEKELLIAARHRRQLAADNYYHNPPKPDDVWICEFCEYERIFGEPPRALIRDYEIKDRRHRQEEADRKRLLEKAKAKSRKGKKGGKAPAKGTQPINQPQDQAQSEHLGDQDAPPLQIDHSHSTQSEEEYEDDYEEQYASLPPDRGHKVDEFNSGKLPLGAKT